MTNAGTLQSCQESPCTKAIIKAFLSNITTGCASDLSAAGITPDVVPAIKKYAEYYDLARQVLCIKEYASPSIPSFRRANSSMSSSNTMFKFCIVDILRGVESYTGEPLNVHTFHAAVSALGASGANLPKNLICTACVQASYNLVRPYLKEGGSRSWDDYFDQQCGPSFISNFHVFCRGVLDADVH